MDPAPISFDEPPAVRTFDEVETYSVGPMAPGRATHSSVFGDEPCFSLHITGSEDY